MKKKAQLIFKKISELCCLLIAYANQEENALLLFLSGHRDGSMTFSGIVELQGEDKQCCKLFLSVSPPAQKPSQSW